MKKQTISIYTLLLMGIFLVFASSCKKEDDNNNGVDDNNTGIPILTTTAITEITQTTATSGGNITSDGGATVTVRGVCWSTNQSPTIADSKTTDGTGTGNFTSAITNLTANTTYYVRAYATNSNGTAYGTAKSFTTQEVSTENTFTDPRDGKVYKTVTIGNQVWMAENLAYLPSVVGSGTGSCTTAYCYVFGYDGTDVTTAKSTSKYATYGVLYNWTAAQSCCPDGWHLPSDAEFTELVNYLADNGYNYDGTIGGGSHKIAKAMADLSRWNSSSNIGAVGNTDYSAYRNKSGFTALPGGYRDSDGVFFSAGYDCYWWSATQDDTYGAWNCSMSFGSSSVFRGSNYYDFGFSVRCVRD